ncbi:hypothetical protein ASF98_11475 [Arthrobacter sp. Leaf337]|uniref:hypothetical protein n=1 Tax=Arthrobacter sp. Leaf337 TaxID=1736342 RepID=UPI0006F5C256|nr:hypothetical protein [Arthrobacter sp. Leaf337]KQR64122.1 hypothetical protein ASF98_11475 [Arthrobacter sp. Leaf337]
MAVHPLVVRSGFCEVRVVVRGADNLVPGRADENFCITFIDAPHGIDREERLVLADPQESSGSNDQEPDLFLRCINQ